MFTVNLQVVFAIPINSIMNIVESSVEKGCISKPYIGINVQDVSAETQQYRIPDTRAVLQRGDVVTNVDGKAMTSKPTPATYLGAGHG